MRPASCVMNGARIVRAEKAPRFKPRAVKVVACISGVAAEFDRRIVSKRVTCTERQRPLVVHGQTRLRGDVQHAAKPISVFGRKTPGQHIDRAHAAAEVRVSQVQVVARAAGEVAPAHRRARRA